VGVTRTYANENEEQPGGFVGRILKEYYKTVKKIVLCVICCFGAVVQILILGNT